jgi:hypothetical protein
MESGADHLASPATIALVHIDIDGFNRFSDFLVIFQGSRPPL